MAQLDNTTPISNSMYYTGPIEPGMQILSIYFGPSNWPNWIITAHFQEEEKKKQWLAQLLVQIVNQKYSST